MRCNICGCEQFKDVNGRRNILCLRCGSYPRTRMMKLYIDRLELPANARVLHLAPERGLMKVLREQWSDYVPADFDVERYGKISDLRRVDLTDLDSYSELGTFDLLLHSHVLEHLRCNYTAVLIKLHKQLRSKGYHLFSVPIHGKAYSESFEVLPQEEATLRFGQFDHVRRFAAADIGRTLGTIFDLRTHRQPIEVFGEVVLTEANIPRESWNAFTGATVFQVRQDALRL